jgi:PTH1 family peptidyl-tRNA hydrolase
MRKARWLARYQIGKGSWRGRPIVLVKPLTYMNRSGDVLRSVLRHVKAGREDLLVVYDNLDLDTGIIKMKLKGSSGGHRGLESIFSILKTTGIARLSIGIGRPHRKGGVVDHVLGDPDQAEAEILEKAIGDATQAVLRLVKEPLEKVMGDVNRRKKKDAHT